MKNKKRLLSLLAVFCAFVLIVGGAFAFFADEAALTEITKVGTVDISARGMLFHTGATDANGDGVINSTWIDKNNNKEVDEGEIDTTGLNNLNPGDNDPTVPKDFRGGTDHELMFEVEQ